MVRCRGGGGVDSPKPRRLGLSAARYKEMRPARPSLQKLDGSGSKHNQLFFSMDIYVDTHIWSGGGKEGWEGEGEGEIPPLITSWVTAPAGRCQNPTLSDVSRVGEKEREAGRQAGGRAERQRRE